MKKNASPFRRLFLTKNFILMLVMLVVIIMAISAWFTVYKTVSASNISVKAVSTEVSIAESVKSADGQSEGPGEFKDSITFNGIKFVKDCTGDGKQLIVPEFNNTNDFDSVRLNGGKEVNENRSGHDAVCIDSATEKSPEYHYAEYVFYLRSKNKDVYLDTDSILLSETEAAGTSLTATPATAKKSSYGNFNVDGLVGAMRVALIGQTCTSVTQTWGTVNNAVTVTASEASQENKEAERQLLWDPRPDVQLNIPSTPGNITTWSLSQLNSIPSDYHSTYYKNKTSPDVGLEKIIADKNTDPKAKVSTRSTSYTPEGASTALTLPFLQSPANISTFSSGNDYAGTLGIAPDKDHRSSEDFEQYYLTRYTMRIWIEGTDNEARRAMDGGKFKLIMNFR